MLTRVDETIATLRRSLLQRLADQVTLSADEQQKLIGYLRELAGPQVRAKRTAPLTDQATKHEETHAQRGCRA